MIRGKNVFTVFCIIILMVIIFGLDSDINVYSSNFDVILNQEFKKYEKEKIENCRLFAAVIGDCSCLSDVQNQLNVFSNPTHYQQSGWGLACYDDVLQKGLLPIPGYPMIVRSPIPVSEDHTIFSAVSEMMVRLCPQVIVGHLRNATSGCANISNAHPFLRKSGSKYYTFAHNGTVWGNDLDTLINDLIDGWSEPINCPEDPIDTEYMFIYFLKILEESGLNTTDALVTWASNLKSNFNLDWSALNVVVSDGVTIWGVRCRRRTYGFPLNYGSLDLDHSGYIIGTDILSPQAIPMENNTVIKLEPYQQPVIVPIPD